MDGAYRTSAASRAFPGWTAVEIHAALNEEMFSAEKSAVLERVGAVLGEREGTGPDDDPLLGAQRRRSRAAGHAEGRAELARALLAARGIEVSAEFPGDAIVEAASSCVCEADFRKRLLHR